MGVEALYYKKNKDRVQCLLCPHHCIIPDGGTGSCRVRRNENGSLIAETWGMLSAVNFDPIEKKPLYHFYPGRTILSLGSVGCNMTCKCCQNWQISQTSAAGYPSGRTITPPEILKLSASRKDNIGVAYTYNEPAIWFEYMLDVARLVSKSGQKNIMVSNGYINEGPLMDLMQHMDAFNIDLKGFSEDFYRRFAGAGLAPVLHSLELIRKAGRHLEITCLIIPGLNDDVSAFSRLISWTEEKLGPDTVLHMSRYHPAHKLDIEPTPPHTLEVLYKIAREKLSYVYVGNILLKDYQDTQCSRCGETVIRRTGYRIEINSLTDKGMCKVCGQSIVLL